MLLLQFKPGDISGPADLAQLLDLQWKKAAEKPAAVAGGVAAVEEPPAATALTAAGVAWDRLSAAQDSLKKAKEEADAAAVVTGDPNAAELKKAADKKVEAASLQEELAKIAVLCHDNAASAPLGKLFNLPLSAMERFRPFGM